MQNGKTEMEVGDCHFDFLSLVLTFTLKRQPHEKAYIQVLLTRQANKKANTQVLLKGQAYEKANI